MHQSQKSDASVSRTLLFTLLSYSAWAFTLAGLSYVAKHWSGVWVTIPGLNGVPLPLLALVCVMALLVFCWCIVSWTPIVYEDQSWQYHVYPNRRPRYTVGRKPNELAPLPQRPTRWSMLRRRIVHVLKRCRYAPLGILAVLAGLVPMFFSRGETTQFSAFEVVWYALVHEGPLLFGMLCVPAGLGCSWLARQLLGRV